MSCSIELESVLVVDGSILREPSVIDETAGAVAAKSIEIGDCNQEPEIRSSKAGVSRGSHRYGAELFDHLAHGQFRSLDRGLRRFRGIFRCDSIFKPPLNSVIQPCPRIWPEQYAGWKAMIANPTVKGRAIIDDSARDEIRISEIRHCHLVAVCRNAQWCYEVSFDWYTSKGKLNLWKLSPLSGATFPRATSRSLMAWRVCNSASQGSQPIASNSSLKNPETISSRAVRQRRSAGDRKMKNSHDGLILDMPRCVAA